MHVPTKKSIGFLNKRNCDPALGVTAPRLGTRSLFVGTPGRYCLHSSGTNRLGCLCLVTRMRPPTRLFHDAQSRRPEAASVSLKGKEKKDMTKLHDHCLGKQMSQVSTCETLKLLAPGPFTSCPGVREVLTFSETGHCGCPYTRCPTPPLQIAGRRTRMDPSRQFETQSNTGNTETLFRLHVVTTRET